MLTSWQWNALFAILSIETQFTPTLIWAITVTVHWITSSFTDWDITNVTSPSRHAFQFSIISANEMGLLVLLRNFTSLKVIVKTHFVYIYSTINLWTWLWIMFLFKIFRRERLQQQQKRASFFFVHSTNSKRKSSILFIQITGTGFLFSMFLFYL